MEEVENKMDRKRTKARQGRPLTGETSGDERQCVGERNG